MPIIPFARQSKDDPGYSGERLKNLFIRQSDGFVGGVLIGRSGLKTHVDLGGPVRAIADDNGTMFAVANGAVFSISDGVATNVGAVADDVNTQIAIGTNEVAITAGGTYYVCDGTTTTAYATGAVTDPVGVAFMDGYFVVAGTSGGRSDAITVSDLDDGTTFDALDFAFAEGSSDEIVGIIRDHNEIWLFGGKTVEVWYNSGASGFPFERNAGAMLERGCTTGTMAKEDNSTFWVGEDRRVYRSGGTSPQVISTREVENVLAEVGIVRGFTVDDKGHKFYVIKLAGRPAYAYDMTTGMWCEFSTGLGESEWSGACSARSGSAFYVGTDTGQVATLDAETYQDIGDYIEALAVSVPIVRADYFTINRVHLNVKSGRGDPAGNIMLQASKNGQSWGLEKWRLMGSLGEFFRRVVWHGFGASRRWQFRVRITDAVQRDIYGVQYD